MAQNSQSGVDPVIEVYKKDIDRTLLRENLKLSVEDRLRQLMELQRFAEKLQRAGRAARIVTDFSTLLRVLDDQDVAYILVGGAAATVHGSAPLDRGLNFTLTTKIGPIDLLGEIAGGGTYEQLLPDTDEVTAFGATCRCVTLDRLIHLKRSAGRVKDLEAIAEMEALREERGSG